MVRKVVVTFFRPQSVRDTATAKHTDTEPQKLGMVRGSLEHRTMTRAQTDLGVGDANNWTYIGGLPRGWYPNTRWRARANVEGRERDFAVSGAARTKDGWQIALREE